MALLVDPEPSRRRDTPRHKSKRKLFQKKRNDSFSAEEITMIEGVQRLAKLTVKDIMVPRIDAVFASLEHDVANELATMLQSGHSRFPIYSGTIDNVVGIVYVKDILASMVQHTDKPQSNNSKVRDASADNTSNMQTTPSSISHSSPFPDLEKIMRKPYFIPDSKRLDELLREMRQRRVHIAVVVDEYGGVSGLASLEDIIEEIVGEIRDEFDNEQDQIIHIRDHIYLCDARVSLNELNQKYHLELPTGEVDTLGGFVFDLLGKIPLRYERISFKHIDFVVQEIRGNRIEAVKMIINDIDDTHDDDNDGES